MTFNIVPIAVVRQLNHDNGQRWFSEGTMAFFGSNLESSAYKKGDNHYFISSEQDPAGFAWNGERRFTIRCCDANGVISDIGGFGQYLTLDDAEHALLEIASV